MRTSQDPRRSLSEADRDDLHAQTPTPADLLAESDRALLERYAAARGRLVDAQLGAHIRPPVMALARDALDALAHGQALANVLLAQRWVYARDALRHGAQVRTVARALGLTDAEVRGGLRVWAAGQREHAGMTATERAEVLALVVEGGAR